MRRLGQSQLGRVARTPCHYIGPALHFGTTESLVAGSLSYHQPEALGVLQREGDSCRHSSPLGSVNNGAPGDASVSQNSSW